MPGLVEHVVVLIYILLKITLTNLTTGAVLGEFFLLEIVRGDQTL